MILKNISESRKKLLISGQVKIVESGKTIEGEKIVYDRRVFEEIKKKDLDLVKKSKIKKEKTE